MLVDKLEEKMKGTSVEGTMAHLFRGKFSNYVRCIAVDDRPAQYFRVVLQ